MSRIRSAILLPGLLLGVILGVWTAAAADSAPLTKLSFLPQWSPQAQFAGFYLAQHKGYYRRMGIALTILEGSPNRSPSNHLRTNQADIATLWLSSALQLADQGVPVVNVGQIIQHSALVLAAKKSSEIRTPADMNGARIGLWPGDFQIQPKALFDRYNLNVEVVTTCCPTNLFLRDVVQAASFMWYNEYHSLINFGLDPQEMTIFRFENEGLDFPEDGIYLRKETYEKDPATACAFVSASMQGWRDAFADPEATIDLVLRIMEQANIPTNRVHQRWMLKRMEELMRPGAGSGRLGALQKKDYQRVGKTLQARELIDTFPPFESFFIRACQP